MRVKLFAYGDTTGKCLEILGQAVQCPERNDYHFPCKGSDEQFQIMATMRYFINKLDLKIMLVAHSSNNDVSVRVTSTFPIGVKYPSGKTRRVK